jgi:hypothetical protein
LPLPRERSSAFLYFGGFFFIGLYLRPQAHLPLLFKLEDVDEDNGEGNEEYDYR